MTKYPANTRPEKPESLIDPQRPRYVGDPPRWVMRIRFLFYRLVSPFVKAAIASGIWEDQQAS